MECGTEYQSGYILAVEEIYMGRGWMDLHCSVFVKLIGDAIKKVRWMWYDKAL